MVSRQSALTFLGAAAASASIWLVAPWATGRAEPWDADGLFYLVALVLAGLISGWLRPRPLWAHYAGAVVGQLAYQAIFLPVGPLILLGAVFLLAFSVVFLAAAVLAAFLRRKWRQRHPQF